MKATVIGGSGYIGGELIRLLLAHPRVELVQVTSDRLDGQPVTAAHPNLRGHTDLRFIRHREVQPSDVVFLAVPHGLTRSEMPGYLSLAPLILDLSADFRLRDTQVYRHHYKAAHPNEGLLPTFVYGLPELKRAELRLARRVAVAGCMATAAILALYPVAATDLVSGEVLFDCLTGSSGSGGAPTPAGHHAERSGVMRVFKPGGHRHEAEIEQACGVRARMSATGVEAVRGILAIGHLNLRRALTDRDAWSLFRQRYGGEPFVRLVKQKTGVYQLPEPKLLSGTNYCDLGFELSPDGLHLVLIAALDNLVKGGAGNAVQCLNIMAGWNEREGLEFAGLHPI